MTIARTLTYLLAFVILVAAPLSAHGNPDPKKGRFLQRDPNSTGVVVLNNATWFLGRAPIISPDFIDARTMYGDGMNLYEYLGSNPIVRTDPMGLSWDPFVLADDFASEHQMSGLVVFAKLHSFFNDKQVLRAIRSYERGAFEWSDMVMDRDAGILLSIVGAPFLSRMCFVEGTLVETPEGAVPIETLTLGRAVRSEPDPSAAPLIDAVPAVGHATYVVLTLEYCHPDGRHTRIELLRPSQLLAVFGVAVGQHLPVAVPEIGILGQAAVLSIESFGELPHPEMPVVTGRFITQGANVVDIFLREVPQPIGATPNHLIFSEDRQSWARAEELLGGERLRCASRQVAVVANVANRRGRYVVHNLEINRYHTYYVSDARVLVHNTCEFPIGKGATLRDQRAWIAGVVKSMQDAMKGGSTTNPAKVIGGFVRATIQEASTLNKGALSKEAYEELMRYLDELLS